MGCCVSTSRNDDPSANFKKHHHFNVGSESESPKTTNAEIRAPPRSMVLLEEETVKEVLSETPSKLTSHANFIIPSDIQDDDQKKTQIRVLEKIQEEEIDFKIERKAAPTINNVNNTNSEEVASEVSEICSLSESVSTTTITDSRRDHEDEEEVRQPSAMKILRSPAKLTPPTARNRVVGKSPTRRSDQSPGRRNGVGIGGCGGGGGGSVRLVQGREASQGMGRRGSRSDQRMRDPRESSGRRSMSPATNRSAMGPSPSAKRTNRSPGRVRLDRTESSGKRVEESTSSSLEGKWPSSSNVATNKNGTTNESLENPLVSLECFIFL